MRILTLFLAILFVVLQIRLWAGKNSIADYVQLRKQVAEQQQTNVEVKERNRLLFAEIDDLRNGQSAIEERARNELGFIGPDETFFRYYGASDK